MIAKDTVTTRLGDITKVRTGKLDANAQRPGGAYPFFTCGEETLAIDHYAFDTEAVLLAGNGNFNVKWYKGKFNAYQRTYVIEPNGVYGKWLFYGVQAALRKITSGHRGSVIRFIRLGDIVDSTVALPPLDDQQRIVAEIEKQFTRLDAGVKSLKRVQTALKRYRASVLKAACEGRLVATEAELAHKEKRSYETGQQLLQRILKQRREGWNGKGKYKEPAAPDTTGLGQIPQGWALASLDQLNSHITSGSRDWSQFYGKGDDTFILARNVRPLRLDLTERQSVAAPKGDAEAERTRVRMDDLLVTIVGAKTGDACRVPVELADHYVCQSVAMLRPIVPHCAKFVEIFVASPENGQAQWKHYIYGQGRPHLSFEQLRMTAIPLPPLPEQQRIVTEVDRRLSVLEDAETVVTSNLRRSARLQQSVLRSAFSGQS